jgi:hypothetical protein
VLEDLPYFALVTLNGTFLDFTQMRQKIMNQFEEGSINYAV